MTGRPRPKPITGHWHGWTYVLGPVEECPGCNPNLDADA